MTLFSELKGDFSGFSDTTVGFKLRFLEGMMTGSLSSSLKAVSSYRHMIENLLAISFTSQIDFWKPEKPSSFGVGISIGGM